ncbi:hypothetical protein [Chromobacterium sphagni]|uniref:Uncharacterized protein n=1 Tax=Chromobacterium sphagni TaxID=1903179 RepID=A0ABX3CBH9_9NEIS|nr:hypothetical protein [Chromobacterium sphagni]OHX19566.1 hypothetical protein BI344_17835 [Chromobacterium sphagni]
MDSFTQGAPAPSSNAPFPFNPTREEQFADAVQCISGLATIALGQIAAIGRLTLSAMEVPNTYLHPENIAQALETIICLAERLDGTIDSHAVELCCRAEIYPEEQIRRGKAFCAAWDSQRGGEAQ